MLGPDNPSLVTAVREGNPNRKERKDPDQIELVSMTIKPGEEIVVGQRLRARSKRRPQKECDIDALKGQRFCENEVTRSKYEYCSRCLLLHFTVVAQAQLRPVIPIAASSRANPFYSPAVDAGDYVYISAQGPRTGDGASPPTFRAQVHQALDNIKAIVESAGLTMDHVVYTQVYLEDISKYEEMNAVFAEYFRKAQPARAVLGVARIPDPPIRDQCGCRSRSGQPPRDLSAKL